MLNAEEEQELVDELSLHSQDRWMQLLLRAKCKKVGQKGGAAAAEVGPWQQQQQQQQ